MHAKEDPSTVHVNRPDAVLQLVCSVAAGLHDGHTAARHVDIEGAIGVAVQLGAKRQACVREDAQRVDRALESLRVVKVALYALRAIMIPAQGSSGLLGELPALMEART